MSHRDEGDAPTGCLDGEQEEEAFDSAWGDAATRIDDGVDPFTEEVIAENSGYIAALFERIDELEERVEQLEAEME
jgi:polyhydroxyalkanoate synthesis regulator phasin